MTGRHLRCYRQLSLNNVLGSLRACRLFRLALRCFTLCSFTFSRLTCRSFLSLTLHTLRTRLRTLLTTLRKTLAALCKTLTG